MKKIGFLLTLMIIVIAAAWLRFANLAGYIWNLGGYDESRDMLVAKHIVSFGEHVWRGPLAAGGLNILKNSPFYYYFVASLWFIGRSPYGVMILWSLLMVSMVAIAYKIGNQLWDKTTGLCMAALIAVHPELVSLSHNISQPNLLPLWVLLVIWSVTRKKYLSIIDLFISIFLVFLSLHIHYGAFIILPVFYAWITWVWWAQRSKKEKVIAIIFPILISECVLYVWALLTYQYVLFDQFHFFQINAVGHHPSFVLSVISVAKEVLRLVWPNIPLYVASITTVACVVFSWRNHSRWLHACAFLPILFYCVYIGRVEPTYLLSLIPIWLLIIAIGIRIFIGMQPIFGVVSLLIITIFFASQSYPSYRRSAADSLYQKNLPVAQAIFQDYLSNKDVMDREVPSFVLATLDISQYLVYDGWGTGSTWFWLENFFHKRLISLTDNGTNFYPRVTSPKYFYLICDHRDTGPQAAPSCLRRFTSVRSYLSEQYKTIFQSQTFSVWRFDIVGPLAGQYYNVAYEDLLHPKK